MINIITLIKDSSIIIFLCLVILLILGTITKKACIIDSFWSLGFAIIYWFLAYNYLPVSTTRTNIYAAMLTTWSLRLSIFLTIRNWNASEDIRYTNIRKAFCSDKYPLIQLLGIFSIQCILILILSIHNYNIIINHAVYINPLNYLGIFIFITGLFVESIADWQLRKFKTNQINQGKVCNHGLWYYSRHPNYFGEILIWLGFALYNSHNIYWSLASWLNSFFMIYLIIKISGLYRLENNLEKKYSQDFIDYKKQTSALIPWWPKK